MSGRTRRIAQYDASSSIRSITVGIGRAKYRNHWNPQRRRQVHGTCVASYKQARPARQSYQFTQRTRNGLGRTPTRGRSRPSQIFFAWTIVENRGYALVCQAASYLAISFHRPPLCAPTSPRIQNDKLADSTPAKPASHSPLPLGTT